MSKYEILELKNEQPSAKDLGTIVRAVESDLAVIDNHAVNALMGNANNPNLGERIAQLKGEDRGTLQPVGWTPLFDDRVLSTVDKDYIANNKLKKVFSDPELLTALGASIAFFRTRASLQAKHEHAIPDCIIPKGKISTVQIYSPAGTTTTEHITRAAMERGIEPIMTSANRSREPETVSRSGAINFIEECGEQEDNPPALAVFINGNKTRMTQPRGSYPVIVVERDRLVILRPGCFESAIIEAIFDDYPISPAPNQLKNNHPDSILRMEHLPPEIQKLKGKELRIGLLTILGWQAE
jgi:hypothetical protein